jgi:hypothetical protein
MINVRGVSNGDAAPGDISNDAIFSGEVIPRLNTTI